MMIPFPPEPGKELTKEQENKMKRTLGWFLVTVIVLSVFFYYLAFL